ncbi:MAG: hypothetical protein ACFB51_19835 [Anaerolineae bacterium]
MDEMIALIGGGTIALIIGSICFSILIAVGAIFLVRRAFGPNRKLLTQGLEGEGTIISIRETGTYVNNMPQALIRLEVTVPGWSPYEAETRMVVSQFQIPQFQPGAKVRVRVDPDNKEKIAIEGLAT